MTPVEMESLDRTEMESGALRTVQDVSLSRTCANIGQCFEIADALHWPRALSSWYSQFE